MMKMIKEQQCEIETYMLHRGWNELTAPGPMGGTSTVWGNK